MRDFVRSAFSDAPAASIPFGLSIGGRPAPVDAWKRQTSSGPGDGETTIHTVKLDDPATGLSVRVEAVECGELPAVEWVVHVKNNGTVNTPLLEQILGLDAAVPCPDSCVIHYNRGALCSIDDFAPVERRFRKGSDLRLTPGGGRSSSEVLPFFNVDCGGRGVIVAIGWTGEWAMQLTRSKDGPVRMRAGMDLTRLVLHPGEEIRTPRILLLFWHGDRRHGQNMLRHHILQSHRPKVDGVPLVVPTFVGSWGGTSAAVHVGNLERLSKERLPAEFYWIDAGWFGTGPWHLAPGTWKENAALYPKGMKEIGDAVHRGGRKFLLWFEPQRVTRDSVWAREHPEWLLRIAPEDEVTSWPVWDDTEDPMWRFAESKRNRIAPGDALLDLGNPEARRFLTDFISQCIGDFGLDCYREDFNIAPLAFWRRADPPDRQGMTEIRWIEGLYAFWDALLARHPGLMIDNCASGGRRIDIETLGRATPLWRTDAPGSPEGRQCHTWGLAQWVPLHCTGGLPDLTVATDYEFRSSLNAGLIVGFWNGGDNPQDRPFPEGIPYERARTLLQTYGRLRPCFYGEFYPLSAYSTAMDAWLAIQYDRSDLGEGMVVVFKRPQSAIREAVYQLQGLDASAVYEVRNEDTGSTSALTGHALAGGGLIVRLEARPDSALFVYKRISTPTPPPGGTGASPRAR